MPPRCCAAPPLPAASHSRCTAPPPPLPLTAAAAAAYRCRCPPRELQARHALALPIKFLRRTRVLRPADMRERRAPQLGASPVVKVL